MTFKGFLYPKHIKNNQNPTKQKYVIFNALHYTILFWCIVHTKV